MVRKPRVWFKGATYHITARGNRKAPIFHHEHDYRKYLALLEEVRLKYPFILHAYCLMPNHIHMLLETIDHPLGSMMHELQSKYAMYFNKKYDLTGHVFQGRYHDKLIDSLDHFIVASRYIHLNPVEAEMVKDAEYYPWSSYSGYITEKRNPHITTEKILQCFPKPERETYKRFVENRSQILLGTFDLNRIRVGPDE